MEFVKTEHGVCGLSPLQSPEFTLCGDAFDGYYRDSEVHKPDAEREYESKPHESTDKKVITCRKCAAVVLECRGVRVKVTE